jgi:hypothetical protein
VTANNQPEAASVDIEAWLSTATMMTMVAPLDPAPAFLLEIKASMLKRTVITLKRWITAPCPQLQMPEAQFVLLAVKVLLLSHHHMMITATSWLVV